MNNDKSTTKWGSGVLSWSDMEASKLARRMAELSPKRPSLVAAAAALALGFSVWAGLGLFSEGAEPWDDHVQLYLLGQGVSGLLLGLIWPDFVGPLWLLFLLGQGIAAGVGSFFGDGTGVNFFIPLGLVFLILYSLPCLLALFLGRAIRKARTQ
ncbi:MAG TPA: hypothetical protein VMM81_08480 [Acidimicrobiia bacterium]|nr:hypothetical protein [Acidimicrobiia bacterium]